MERVVLDLGVLVSALIAPEGNPARLWQAVVDERLVMVACPLLLAELAGVLERSKFRRYTTSDQAKALRGRGRPPGGAAPRPEGRP